MRYAFSSSVILLLSKLSCTVIAIDFRRVHHICYSQYKDLSAEMREIKVKESLRKSDYKAEAPAGKPGRGGKSMGLSHLLSCCQNGFTSLR